MVVEFLTFTVPPHELDEWLAVEQQHWSRFLERQPGFVRKQMWRSTDDHTAIHAVIWWETMEHWHAIPDVELQRVVAGMGPHERRAECVSFDLLREG